VNGSKSTTMLIIFVVLLIGCVCQAQITEETTPFVDPNLEPTYIVNSPERECPGVSRTCAAGQLFETRTCRCRTVVGEKNMP